MGFPGGSAGKESTCNAGGLCSISGLGKSPEEGKGHPLQYSHLETAMDCAWGPNELDTTERLSFSKLLKKKRVLNIKKTFIFFN